MIHCFSFRRGGCWSLVMLAVLLACAPFASAQVGNVKVVTDANPDYHDIGSMIHSITSRWASDQENVLAAQSDSPSGQAGWGLMPRNKNGLNQLALTSTN